MRKLLRGLGQLLAPGLTRYVGERRYLTREAPAVRSKLDQLSSLEEAVELVLVHPGFRAEQKPSEIVALLRMVQAIRPTRLCEIGARRGGTLAMFSQAAAMDARILSMDIAFSAAQAEFNPRLGRQSQQVACWRADSHDPQLPSRVAQWFGGQLDFLFIDGDHSYEGVRLDYELFSPLVRSGGLIALHDIVPDAEARGLGRSESYSGGVYGFWNELKSRNPSAVEFIDHPDQDGFGLGVVTVP